MFHISIISTGELWLSVLPQVECTSAQMVCVGKCTGKMRKTAAGVHEHTKTVSPPFSTENGLQYDQMTDKLAIYSARLSG